MRRTLAVGTAVGAMVAAVLTVLPATAHPERHTTFPSPTYGAVPAYRTGGPQLVVCAPDSKQRILADTSGEVQGRNLQLLQQCRFHAVQDAIDAATNGTSIEVLPGVYQGRPKPVMSQDQEFVTCGPPEPNTHGDVRKSPPDKYLVVSYYYQVNCPSMHNVFWIIGNSSLTGDCTSHCHLQLEGTGDDPGDVVLEGDRIRPDVLHVDRADGTYLRNFTVEHGAANGINIIETNGFAVSQIVSRRNQNSGVLSFTTDHGLYDHVTTYQNGHAGVYPGSTAEGMDAQGKCVRYPIEMRYVDSYENTYGYSGTAANAVWVHDSSFHDNATGISTDSLSSAHPGMPQDCAKWEHNRIYSNNFNPFAPPQGDPTACSKTPYEQRPDTLVCPYFAAPVGTGIQIGGGNANIAADNWIYDNKRSGIRLFWIPPAVRYPDPRSDDTLVVGFGDVADTSFGNHFVDNTMGVSPDGLPAPNGADFWWDGEGAGNCTSGYSGTAFSGTSLPPCSAVLPAGTDPRAMTVTPYVYLQHPENIPAFSYGDPQQDATQVTCIGYDPRNLPDPPACAWLD